MSRKLFSKFQLNSSITTQKNHVYANPKQCAEATAFNDKFHQLFYKKFAWPVLFVWSPKFQFVSHFTLNFVNMTSVLRYFTSTSAPTTYLFNREIKADALQSEIDKLLFFSYRSGFAPLSLTADPQVSIATDSGWGCTYRFVQCEIELKNN